jgi:hypothetical protein
MTTISIRTESPLETANLEDQTDRKLFDNYGPVNVKESIGTFFLGMLFDNYGPVNVKESIGTFFLGILAILLFLALQRSWNRYQVLIDQTRLLNHP